MPSDYVCLQVEEAVELWHGKKEKASELQQFAKAKPPILFQIPEAEDDSTHTAGSFLTEDESARERSEPDLVNCTCHLFGLAAIL